MRVQCPSCAKHYQIPDERLPVGKEIVFPCPNCKKGLIRTTVPPPAPENDPPASPSPPETLPKDPPETAPADQNLPGGYALKMKILRNLSNLPAMPQVMVRAQEIMANPGSDLRQLSELIETDPSLTAMILKLSNSAYYGLSGKVVSVKHASVLLGYKTLGEVISMAASSELLGRTLPGYGTSSDGLWRHSLAVALGTKIIANRKNADLVNDAFIAGLLHDVGKIMLDPCIVERQALFREFMQDGLQTFLSAEKALLGFDHSEIAFDICKLWRLPLSVANAIKWHHYPSRSEENELAYMLHMADAAAMMCDIGAGIGDVLYKLEDNTMELLGLEASDVSWIMRDVATSVDKISSKIDPSSA
jgi:HD-like signal output (HDOD) protein